MKEQPPISVLLAAGITIAYSGSVFAEMIVPALHGLYNLYSGFIFGIMLGYGLLKGFEISRFWIMLLSGLTGLINFGLTAELITGERAWLEDFSVWTKTLMYFVLGGVVFWCVKSAEARAWCRESTLNTRMTLRWTSLFGLLGLVLALPSSVQESRMERAYPVSSRFTFQTEPKGPLMGPITYRAIGLTERFDGKDLPKLAMAPDFDGERNPAYSIKGVAVEPVTIYFTMPGFEKCVYTISNGSPSEVKLTLVAEKQPVRAERKAE